LGFRLRDQSEKNMKAKGTMKLALLRPRDVPKWHAPTPRERRLNRAFEELAALGIQPEPTLYADDVVDQVRAQLMTSPGWIGA
jgi:hypothetical protein